MSEEQWIWQFERVIPSDPAAGREALEELLGQLRSRQWSQKDVFAVHLAVEEALVNAIEHGNRLAADKYVQLRSRISRETIQIEIADEGDGFDPSVVPDPTTPERRENPGGRGVMLIKAFMSQVRYNESGNQVFLEKRKGSEIPQG